jgi:hypothetical protein
MMSKAKFCYKTNMRHCLFECTSSGFAIKVICVMNYLELPTWICYKNNMSHRFVSRPLGPQNPHRWANGASRPEMFKTKYASGYASTRCLGGFTKSASGRRRAGGRGPGGRGEDRVVGGGTNQWFSIVFQWISMVFNDFWWISMVFNSFSMDFIVF